MRDDKSQSARTVVPFPYLVRGGARINSIFVLTFIFQRDVFRLFFFRVDWLLISRK